MRQLIIVVIIKPKYAAVIQRELIIYDSLVMPRGWSDFNNMYKVDKNISLK